MQNLNVHTVPLRHKNLIEASAGTGKTWTLSFLYLRLILQEGYLVSQILVVTYTNAATDELRDRIRQRLVEAKLQQALVDEYWRQHLQQASDAMTDLLVEQGITPVIKIQSLKCHSYRLKELFA